MGRDQVQAPEQLREKADVSSVDTEETALNLLRMAAAPVAALRTNWKKVSSTDNLQAFAEEQGASILQGTAKSRFLGLCMILLSAALVTAGAAVLVAKLMRKPTGILFQTLHEDSYYCYLVPFMVPMAVVGVTLNWFSLKLFKHNS